MNVASGILKVRTCNEKEHTGSPSVVEYVNSHLIKEMHAVYLS